MENKGEENKCGGSSRFPGVSLALCNCTELSQAVQCTRQDRLESSDLESKLKMAETVKGAAVRRRRGGRERLRRKRRRRRRRID